VRKLFAVVSFAIAFSAHASQEAVLDQIEANPTAKVKSQAVKAKAQKVERAIPGWYFE